MDLTELPETLDEKQIVEINGATVDLFENSKNSVYLLKEMQTKDDDYELIKKYFAKTFYKK